jgi:hypothetical protein
VQIADEQKSQVLVAVPAKDKGRERVSILKMEAQPEKSQLAPASFGN